MLVYAVAPNAQRSETAGPLGKEGVYGTPGARRGAGGNTGLLRRQARGVVFHRARPTYRKLGGLEDPAESPDAVWSLVCMFVPRRLRGQGIAKLLVSGAVDHARNRGASVVEAYPVDPESPSYKFMGVIPTFAGLGFEEVGRAGTRRHVMRLRL